MRKALGLIVLLAVLAGATYAWEMHNHGESRLFKGANLRNLFTYIGLFGILSLAQALVIITGGIDLSVGSVVGLVGIVAAMLLDKGNGWSPFIVVPLCLGMAVAIGAWHGFLVAKVRIQPFIVTLCGLFLYRGIARGITGDGTQGFGTAFPRLRWFGKGFVGDIVPAPFIVLVLLAIVVGAYLHLSAQGRHLFAMGANEEAARFSGIRTTSLKILAYVMCSLITGLGGLLLAFKVNSLGPSDFGSFWELYAIAGAVLGGCGLRGGSGNVLGVAIGAALIMVLRNLVNILEIPSQLEYVVIGSAILIGVCTDELLARRGASRAHAT